MSRLAVVAAQAILNVGGARLRLDGRFGPQTRSAIAASSPQVRAVLEELTRHFPLEEDADHFNAPEMRAIVQQVAEELNFPPEFALRVAEAESRFDPRAVSRKQFVGLFQIGPLAIRDVGAAGFRDVPPNGDTTNPRWNAQVGIRYLMRVAGYMHLDYHDPKNWPSIYGAFNLGPGNMATLLAGRFDDPSLKSAVASQAGHLADGGPRMYLANVPSFLGLA